MCEWTAIRADLEPVLVALRAFDRMLSAGSGRGREGGSGWCLAAVDRPGTTAGLPLWSRRDVTRVSPRPFTPPMRVRDEHVVQK
jgi:hypothetical protein